MKPPTASFERNGGKRAGDKGRPRDRIRAVDRLLVVERESQADEPSEHVDRKQPGDGLPVAEMARLGGADDGSAAGPEQPKMAATSPALHCLDAEMFRQVPETRRKAGSPFDQASFLHCLVDCFHVRSSRKRIRGRSLLVENEAGPGPAGGSAPDEGRRALFVEGVHAFAEILRCPKPAVAVALELDGRRQQRVVGVVQELLRRALGQRREADQFLDKRVDDLFQIGIRNDLRRDAPVVGFLARDPLRAHHDVLGAG